MRHAYWLLTNRLPRFIRWMWAWRENPIQGYRQWRNVRALAKEAAAISVLIAEELG